MWVIPHMYTLCMCVCMNGCLWLLWVIRGWLMRWYTWELYATWVIWKVWIENHVWYRAYMIAKLTMFMMIYVVIMIMMNDELYCLWELINVMTWYEMKQYMIYREEEYVMIWTCCIMHTHKSKRTVNCLL